MGDVVTGGEEAGEGEVAFGYMSHWVVSGFDVLQADECEEVMCSAASGGCKNAR